MQSLFKDVEAFHTMTGTLVGPFLTLPDANIRTLRENLLKEEFTEFLTALDEQDYVEVCDALVDIVYIACGTALSYGAWNPSIDVATPLLYYADDLVPGFTAATYDARDIVVKAYETVVYAEKTNDPVVIGCAIEMLIHACLGAAKLINMPFLDCWTEIQKSNMAKAGPDGKIRRRDDGKILKPASWSPPNIAAVLSRHGWAGPA
jgi:predicted HAD superfamily Cof-like phosphohydrolase